MLILSNCELSKVLSTPTPRKVAVSFENDSTLVLGLGFKPAVRVTIDGELVTDPEIRYTSSDTMVIAVSAPGDSLIARRLGTARITASLQGTLLPDPRPSASDTIHVIPKEFIITPSAIAFSSLGDSISVTAAALDANNRAILNIPITWESSEPGAVSVSAFGIAVARQNTVNPVTISARLAGVTVSVPVTVEQLLDHFVFIPTRHTLNAIGKTTTIGVSGRDRRGNPIGALSGVQWQSGNAGVLSVTTGGVVTSLDNGLSFVRVTSGLVSDTVDVDVEQVATSINIFAPAGLAIRSLGGTLKLIARAFDSENIEVRQKKASWVSLDGNVARVDTTGTVEALGIGTARIVARVDAATAIVTVVVSNEPAEVIISPPEVSMTSIGATRQLVAIVRNGAGSEILQAPVSWSTLDPATASVSSTGLVSALAVGTTRITASSGAQADTSLITVTNNPASIVIEPNAVALTFVGQTMSPTVTITNSLGAALPRSAASWLSDDPSIARVSSDGVITAIATGTTVVHAISGSVSDVVTVVVTNEATTVVLNATRDTLTGLAQQVTYTATVLNQGGLPTDAPQVLWQSSDPGVASVSGTSISGVVTVTYFGEFARSTQIIARSGSGADTIQLIVANLTRLYVDNSVFASPRTGTASRPYAKIMDAVNAADADDTVIVMRGGTAYSETVALSRRIVLLGDSTNFNRSSPNPTVLPLISHDTGSAGITAITASSQVIRFFRMRHTTDGASIDARGPDIRIGHVYINEGETTPAGRGIVVDNTSTAAFASVEHIRISAVRGYGVRFASVANGVIRNVVITRVDSIPGTSGAGIEASNSSGVLIDADTIRLTGGTQVLLRNLSSATVSRVSLGGRHQLLHLVGASGNTQILTSSFDLQLRSDEPFSAGSSGDGRSGVHVDASEGVTLRDNVFVDALGGMMDGIRITGSRGSGALSATSFGASLIRNRFTGGRYNVRSTLSTWMSEGMRSTGAVKGVLSEGTEAIAMFGDTISSAGSGCVEVAGGGSEVTVRGGFFDVCAGGTATTMQPALRVTGASSILSVDSSYFRGPNTIAIDHAGGGALSVTRNIMFANGTRTLAAAGYRSIVSTTGTASLTFTGNRVRGYGDFAGLHVPAGLSVTLTSNHFSRNRVGVRAEPGSTLNASGNDWFNNDSAAVAYAGATATLENNFWGDSRGLKGTSAAATGDSALGTPMPAAFRAAPVFAGSGATVVLAVRGQTGIGALQTATVRAVDANGNPVSGASVSFSCQSNCGSGGSAVRFNTSTTIVTNAAGLAEAVVDLRFVPRSATIAATVSGSAPATVIVTGQ